jgi:hypothetical protein
MTVAGSDPDKRAYAHYRWAKRYAAERDERSSLAHLRRAIHYTARQRFGGAEIRLDPNLETWDTMVRKYDKFSVRARTDVADGKVWVFPRVDADKGKGEYESIIGGYYGNIVTLDDESPRGGEWPVLTLIKASIRKHRALEDVSLEKDEKRLVKLTVHSGGGSETKTLMWFLEEPLAILESLIHFVPAIAANLKVDQRKIDEMRAALLVVKSDVERETMKRPNAL